MLDPEIWQTTGTRTMPHGRETTERVYALLKAAIAGIHVSAMDRLNLPMLAARFDASLTPCREAAFRLIGERILLLHPNGGFVVPIPTEAELRDLYAVHQLLILTAIGKCHRNTVYQFVDRVADEVGNAGRARRLFAQIAQDCSNGEVRRLIDNLADRLAAPRTVELEVIKTTVDEISVIRKLHEIGNLGALCRAIRSYHWHRTARAEAIQGALVLRHASQARIEASD